MLDKTYSLIESGDSFQAIAFIEEQGDPIEVANVYSDLVFGIHKEKHDTPRMVFIGRAGVRYCLSEASRLRGEDAELADRLKGMAKAIAYNIGAFTWPAWEDPGIVITRSDTIAGLDAARLNLRLTIELGRAPEKLGNGHWLLGAQLLAFGENDRAVEQFASAVEQFRRAKKEDFEQMARGYVSIAKSKLKESAEEGRVELTQAIKALKKMATDDSSFFAEQLESAARFFKNR
jgi:hypothetical protein